MIIEIELFNLVAIIAGAILVTVLIFGLTRDNSTKY